MKKYFFNKVSIALSLMMIMFSSCLKDDSMELDPKKGTNVIEWGNPSTIAIAGSATAAYVFSFEIVPEATIPLTISYSGPEAAAPNDITVNFGLGTKAVVDAYNTAHDQHYEYLTNNALFSLESTSVVIPKGKSKATVNLKLKPNAFNPSLVYGIPLTINSVSEGTISGNFGTIMIVVGAKNKYDGLYEISGSLVDANGIYIGYYPGQPYFVPSDPRKYSLSTTGASSVVFFDEWFPFANYIVVNAATGGFANTGIRPSITFDPTTNNIVSITNASNSATVFTNVSGSFNPADKSINLTWTSGRWKVTEQYKYLGPRP